MALATGDLVENVFASTVASDEARVAERSVAFSRSSAIVSRTGTRSSSTTCQQTFRVNASPENIIKTFSS